VPRFVRIDFYKTEDVDGHAVDIQDAIGQAFALPVGQRRVDFGDSFLLIHNVRRRGHLVLGEVVKVRMTDLPDKVSRTTGVAADLGLEADEGIGRRAHFLYDGNRSALLLQRDKEVRHPAFREGVARPVDADFHLSLVFKPNALERLNRMRVLRKLSFRVARTENPEALREIDLSAAHAIDLLNEHQGQLVDISISVGKSRRASLARQSVLRVARGLFGFRGEEVRRVVVSGREEEGASTEILDMFEDRLVYEARIDDRGRRLDPNQCEALLMTAHGEHANYLGNYRHPE